MSGSLEGLNVFYFIYNVVLDFHSPFLLHYIQTKVSCLTHMALHYVNFLASNLPRVSVSLDS
jgi:hypothetical protein